MSEKKNVIVVSNHPSCMPGKLQFAKGEIDFDEKGFSKEKITKEQSEYLRDISGLEFIVDEDDDKDSKDNKEKESTPENPPLKEEKEESSEEGKKEENDDSSKEENESKEGEEKEAELSEEEKIKYREKLIADLNAISVKDLKEICEKAGKPAKDYQGLKKEQLIDYVLENDIVK